MSVTNDTSTPTVLITGATDGLGRWLAVRLAEWGADVIVHGRDEGRVADTVEAVRHDGGGEPGGTVLADLADLTQVDHLADEVVDRFGTIDVLVNNAGVGFGVPGSPRQFSADGIELRFAVNYLAGYHLTRRLRPALIRSAPARVVNVSSIGQEPIDFGDPLLDDGYTGVRAYRRSKLAQIMFTIDLAEALREHGVTVNALHPASLMDTSMVREMDFTPLSTLHDGGEATLRLITDPALAETTGAFYDQTVETSPHVQALDFEARQQLRDLSDMLVGKALNT